MIEIIINFLRRIFGIDNNKNKKSRTADAISYSLKNIMTNSEYKFYMKLKKLELE